MFSSYSNLEYFFRVLLERSELQHLLDAEYNGGHIRVNKKPRTLVQGSLA